MEHVAFPQNNIPVCGHYDVIICGGGLSGIAAAWHAASIGQKVMLLEYYHKLGGVPVSGMLGIVSGFKNDTEYVVEGSFFPELKKRMYAVDGCSSREDWAFRLAPEKLSMVLLEMMLEKNVDVLLRTSLIAAHKENDEIKYIVTSSKNGIEAWSADLFVDDTGDGDLAFMAGCPFEYGRESDGKVQSSSMTFKIAGIDMSRANRNIAEISAQWKTIKHNIPINHTVITYLPGTNGEAAVNMTHILNCDPMTHEGELRIRREGAKQAFEIAAILRANVAGFEKCYVSETAMQPGIRETRRFIGDYTLTADDVITGRDFPDEIGRCTWGIDIHVPDKIHGETPMPYFCIQQSYGVPYRCIIPKNVKNLYIAGRPISATHEAFSSVRINSTCIATGEAIGIAAELFMKNRDTRKIDITELQNKLAEKKCIFHRTFTEVQK